MKWILAVLLMWCFSVSSFAGSYEGVHPSYVPIQMTADLIDSQPQTMTICGGVIVHQNPTLVATAWHCVPNQRSIIEATGVFTIDGHGATLLGFSAEDDLAIFGVGSGENVSVPSFSTPQKGDMVMAAAYYSDLGVSARDGDRFFPPMVLEGVLTWEGQVELVGKARRVSGERFDVVTPTESEWIVVRGMVTQGFSGGPAFDKKGNFVGIFSNLNNGFTNISSSKNVSVLVARVLRGEK